MFRTSRYLGRQDYVQFNLDTPLVFPGNGQHEPKSNRRSSLWKTRIISLTGTSFSGSISADCANITANTESAPINGSFSLIKKKTKTKKDCVKSAGKKVYKADDIHKVKESWNKFKMFVAGCLIGLIIFDENSNHLGSFCLSFKQSYLGNFFHLCCGTCSSETADVRVDALSTDLFQKIQNQTSHPTLTPLCW